ncbi:BgTH12-06704 [Blumeria graminis f. sp. triticale]|uniref:Bgt-3572 n=3 Tax=Blumeria graminis TaxID=34373 RepID=A0A381LFH5_BLUGR|nr:hypothetical protein BGT96224_3572 [Blumeria graminis f. sp. tritici 96224]CAD6501003.1 BgTH12-06704 [Blumeria graminis f. sp. triticale]VCU41316.1 Bgt-3572 [Blumeria graminis f. sp. tritici]
MGSRTSSIHRLTDGKLNQPLLNKDDTTEVGAVSSLENQSFTHRAPTFSAHNTLRRKSLERKAKLVAWKKYTCAAFCLGISLVTFVIQTETAVYIQHELGWNKAYCMLYLTHGSWSLLCLFQLFISRLFYWNLPWKTFWRRHLELLRSTAQMVETQQLNLSRTQHSPVKYFVKITTLIACTLTIAGGSWYIAISMTSPSDLTAIYNCSAFFAYAFSIPILKEKLRFDKLFAVAVAIIGVLVVAYGDAAPSTNSEELVDGAPSVETNSRVAGNLIIGFGSVLYGFYEVLYKRLACPPEGTSVTRGIIFANTFGSLIGFFTLTILWIPIPILHITGVEKFELPRGDTAWLLIISVLSNATFSGSFLVLISLTSPVLSSVAALLTIFLVAIVDWLWTGVPLSFAAIIGGLLIIAAFLILSWSTFRDISEHNRKKHSDFSDDDTLSED